VCQWAAILRNCGRERDNDFQISSLDKLECIDKFCYLREVEEQKKHQEPKFKELAAEKEIRVGRLEMIV